MEPQLFTLPIWGKQLGVLILKAVVVLVVLGKKRKEEVYYSNAAQQHIHHCPRYNAVELPREAQEDFEVHNGSTTSTGIGSKGLHLNPAAKSAISAAGKATGDYNKMTRD